MVKVVCRSAVQSTIRYFVCCYFSVYEFDSELASTSPRTFDCVSKRFSYVIIRN